MTDPEIRRPTPIRPALRPGATEAERTREASRRALAGTPAGDALAD